MSTPKVEIEPEHGVTAVTEPIVVAADVECYQLPTAACQVLAEIVMSAARSSGRSTSEAA
jgi:hypothetical protein